MTRVPVSLSRRTAAARAARVVGGSSGARRSVGSMEVGSMEAVTGTPMTGGIRGRTTDGVSGVKPCRGTGCGFTGGEAAEASAHAHPGGLWRWTQILAFFGDGRPHAVGGRGGRVGVDSA